MPEKDIASLEYRNVPPDFRSEEGEKPAIRGHFAVFNDLSVPIFDFRERIKPGAFRKTIQDGDVVALLNHDPNYVLGRTGPGTLTLREDDRGLDATIYHSDSQTVKDLVLTPMKRGEIYQGSFAFRTVKGKDDWKVEQIEGKDVLIRTLTEVNLYDVSPVTFPAYPTTDVYARGSVLTILSDKFGSKFNLSSLAVLFAKRDLGLSFSQEEREILTATITAITSCLAEPEVKQEEHHSDVRSEPEPPAVEVHSVPLPEPPQPGWETLSRRMRLRLTKV